MVCDPLVIDVSIAARLVSARFPGWAELPLVPLESSGTDNAVFRLGDHACLRMPRLLTADRQLLKEAEWLPRLGPLPLETPKPLALTGPFDHYPCHAAVYDWLPGATALDVPPSDMNAAAHALAGFLVALRRRPTDGGPQSGPQNQYRGAPLAFRDTLTRKALSRLSGHIDVECLSALWASCLNAPAHQGPGIWLHGDLHGGNLIVADGVLAGVIDFGLIGVGDPAADLTVAWSFLDEASRETFRRALAADEAEWRRGQGWALSTAAIAFDHYRDANPTLSALSLRALKALEAVA